MAANTVAVEEGEGIGSERRGQINRLSSRRWIGHGPVMCNMQIDTAEVKGIFKNGRFLSSPPPPPIPPTPNKRLGGVGMSEHKGVVFFTVALVYDPTQPF